MARPWRKWFLSMAVLTQANLALLAGADPPAAHPMVSMAARTLERQIIAARDGAIEAGVQPIPAEVRAILEEAGFEPERLDRVRYRVGHGDRGMVVGMIMRGGHAHAITLGHVIVFLREDLVGRLDIWAHELVHVKQYDDMGIPTFARQYLLDFASLERPGYAKQRWFKQWWRERNVPDGPTVEK